MGLFDKTDSSENKIFKRLSRLRKLARLSLFIEDLIKGLIPLALWILSFLALWLFEVQLILGQISAFIFAIIFFCGIYYWARNALRQIKVYQTAEIDRHIEKENKVKHRPLKRLGDDLVNFGDKDTETLWQKSYGVARDAIKRLKPVKTRPIATTIDPYALRILIALFFILGLFYSGANWSGNIVRGLVPIPTFNNVLTAESNIIVSIIPPEYTAQSIQTIEGRGTLDDAIEVVQGSQIKINMPKGFGAARLMMGGRSFTIPRSGENSLSLEREIRATEKIKIRQLFIDQMEIPVIFVSDKRPEMVKYDQPEPLPQGTFQIPITVRDDFGVTDSTLTMTLDPVVTEAPVGSDITEHRNIFSAAGEDTDLTPVYDLTWHPWAGLPVVITLKVKDHLGQSATAEPMNVVLPERRFTNPVAKALVEMRKNLIWLPEPDYRKMAFDLEKYLARPDALKNDPMTFLAIRIMASRFKYSPGPESRLDVIELLWDTALRLEDGNLTLAARDLRAAQNKLQQLLDNPNATDQQIDQAMSEFRQALAQYMQELFTEMQKQALNTDNSLPQFSLENFAQNLSPDDLSAFLDKLRAQALSGDRKAAQNMLSQLQNLMDRMDPSRGFQMTPQMEFMAEGINELEELIKKQKELLEQTSKMISTQKSRQPSGLADLIPLDEPSFEGWDFDALPPPPQQTRKDLKPDKKDDTPQYNTALNKTEQEALRYVLGQLMLAANEKLGEIPENMQLAEQEMRLSSDALGNNDPVTSIPHQEKVIEYLEEAEKQMQQQMMQALQNMTLLSFGMGPTDPLGRPLQRGDGDSLLPGETIEIPDEARRNYVREILKILRQRSGEYNRPDYEREYLQRLMKSF